MNLLEKPGGRSVLFTALYVSEGAPIGFIWWALPTLLRARGVPVEKITAVTALLVLPWVFKFLWAPLVDVLRTNRWGFRSWILVMQLLMGASVLPLIWLDPVDHFPWWTGLLLVHALAASTQDVAIDALAVNAVPESQRGSISGSMQAGMLGGRSLFGGGALLVASQLGWAWIYAALILCIWSSMVLLLFVREPVIAQGTGRRRIAEFGGTLGEAFRTRATWAGLAFALTSGAAFEATGALAGPFLLDRGVPQGTIGVFFGVLVVGAMMAGALAGGRLSDRFGRVRALGVFLCGYVGAILALACADHFQWGSQTTALGLLTVMYLFVGLFTAASYALFMDLTNPRLGGTQFSTFMAATNGCESWSGWAGGRIAGAAGYPAGFAAMCAVSLVSIPLLKAFARKR